MQNQRALNFSLNFMQHFKFFKKQLYVGVSFVEGQRPLTENSYIATVNEDKCVYAGAPWLIVTYTIVCTHIARSARRSSSPEVRN